MCVELLLPEWEDEDVGMEKEVKRPDSRPGGARQVLESGGCQSIEPAHRRRVDCEAAGLGMTRPG